MPTTNAQHWTDSLPDSVYALWEAAREYQHAHRAAVLATENVDLHHRQQHDGAITLGWENGAPGPRPHGQALYVLADLYLAAELNLRHRYEAAALLYASGAAWAITAVQGDGTPALVRFATDASGDPQPNTLAITGLDNYSGAPELQAAYEELMVHLDRGGDRTADLALGYGLLAHQALHYALIEPRRQWHSARAVAQAEAAHGSL